MLSNARKHTPLFSISSYHLEENVYVRSKTQSKVWNSCNLDSFQLHWISKELASLIFSQANVFGDIPALSYLYRADKFGLIITQYRQDLIYIGVRWNSLQGSMCGKWQKWLIKKHV